MHTLQKIEDKELFIKAYPMIRKVPYINLTPETCLTRCLSGQYEGMFTCVNNSPVGIVIFRIDGSFCFTIGLYCKNNTRKFVYQFYDYLKSRGVITMRMSSRHPDSFANRILKMEKAWTVYERTL